MDHYFTREWENQPSLWEEFGMRRPRHLLDRLWEEPLSLNRQSPLNDYTYTPLCDSEETESHYLFAMDLPGLDKNQIKIEAAGNVLTVTGERNEEAKKTDGATRMVERRHGQFHRTFTLPREIDVNKIEATYDNGVLRVAIPKTEASHKTRIKITEGKTGIFAKLVGGKAEKAA